MPYPVRFERMSEDLPPLKDVAQHIADARAGLIKAGVPESCWRYDLPPDPRLPGIQAHNRSVSYWNALSPEDQQRADKFCRIR